MDDNSKASGEVFDLIASLDSEFGKKAKQKGKSDAQIARERNTAFHAANPRLESARGQLDRMKFESYYDWEMHKQNLLNIERMQEAGVEQLQWLPEAQVTYVIHQTCGCCRNVTSFTGHEYIRFRGRRRTYRDLAGKSHETYPTRLIPVGKVDGNLLAFGLPGGDPLPDLVEELDETVRRCPGCIQVEKVALDLWVQTTQPNPQGELMIDIEETPNATAA